MTVENIIRSLEDQARDRESSIDEADPDCIFRRDAEALRGALSMIRGSEYTFRLCVAQDGRSIVDMTVGANAVPEEISKAKKTIQRLLNEFAPIATIPPPASPAPLEPEPDEEPEPVEAQPSAESEQPAGVAPAPAQAVIRRPKASGMEGAKGLVILYCETCGGIFGTFLKGAKQEFTCKCGSRIDLTKPMARFRYTCPCCEKVTWGTTNVEEPSFETRCICGNSVMLTWVSKDKEYRG